MHSAAVGRNQTKARVARVARHVDFRLDQQQEGEPQTTQITQMARLPGHGARPEAMSLRPAFALFAFFASFAVPLALRRYNRLPAMTLEGYCQATQRVISRLSENHHGCGDLEGQYCTNRH
jgi:hypothetical protein